jgi:hypothetical protein
MEVNSVMKNFGGKMKFKITCIALLSSVSLMTAQTETTLSFMDNLYQSTYYSPFNKSEFKVSIGLPGISSVYLNAINSGFSASDLAPNGFSQPLDPTDAINKMKKTEFISVNSQVDLFHVFIQKGGEGLSFNITENFNSRFTYPSDMMRFAWKGNKQFQGDQMDFSGFGIDMQHYREYALGYYKTLDKWQFGGKAKMLYGKYTINTKASDLTIDVSDNVYQHTAKGNFELNAGGFDLNTFDNESSETAAQKYLLNKKNKGFALDL